MSITDDDTSLTYGDMLLLIYDDMLLITYGEILLNYVR